MKEMAMMKCKMCGGDMELSTDRSFGTCKYCGSTMTLPKIDDEQRAAAFNRGNHFRRIGEFDKALSVYERIMQEDETDAEAHWCCALCRFGIEYVKDPANDAYLPTCHRLSFDSFLEDVDYQAALKYADAIARNQYQKEGEEIAAVQRGILSISQKEQPFDVFLCYKENDENGDRTVDSTLAQDIYYQLIEQGRRVFFARITLEDKVGREYEPYIFAALHSAKVMVVVGTKPEHFSAVWVKNEWSRYLTLVKHDRKRLILPCYRDMDPYDLPEQLSVLQSYDMSKIGFIQDLIRGIAKVLDVDKKPEAKATVIAQGESVMNLTALLKRGQMALEDGEWKSADVFFDRALNIDAECAEAFWGKLLAEMQCVTVEDFVHHEQTREDVKPEKVLEPEVLEACPPNAAYIESVVEKYQIPEFLPKERIRGVMQKVDQHRIYTSFTAIRKQELEQKRKDLFRSKLFNRTVRYAKDDFAAQLVKVQEDILGNYQKRLEETERQTQEDREQAIQTYADGLEQAERKVAEIYAEVCKKREMIYENAQNTIANLKVETNDLSELQAAAEALRNSEIAFCKVIPYRDSEERALFCGEEAAKLEQKVRERMAHLHLYQKKQTQKYEKKRAFIICTIIVVVIAIVVILTQLIIPPMKYNRAEELLEAGEVTKAAFIFGGIKNYKNAQERSMALWEKMTSRDTLVTGSAHIIGLRSDGTVRAEGRYQQGQCDVSDWYDIVSVGAGCDHSVGLKSDGMVVAIGDNEYGQCDVSDWRDVVSVDAGCDHTVGLKSDGTVVAVGNNYDGRCNVSSWRDIVSVMADYNYTVGLKANGTVIAVGDNQNGQCEVFDWCDIVSVAIGRYHIVGLKSDGTVVAVGWNRFGECDVSDWHDIVSVSSGCDHSVGLKSDGTVVAIGDNEYGQCDVSDWRDIVSVVVGEYSTMGLKSDGTVVATGNNTKGQCNVSAWRNIVSVEVGYGYTVGLKSDGTVVAEGENSNGQCEVSDWTDIKLPS